MPYGIRKGTGKTIQNRQKEYRKDRWLFED